MRKTNDTNADLAWLDEGLPVTQPVDGTPLHNPRKLLAYCRSVNKEPWQLSREELARFEVSSL